MDSPDKIKLMELRDRLQVQRDKDAMRAARHKSNTGFDEVALERADAKHRQWVAVCAAIEGAI